MQPRYFIGITLPDALSRQIAAIQKDLIKDTPVMQPLVPHITLLHPNILMTLSPLYLLPLVSKAAAGLLPISIELTGTAMFDRRVLYAAVKSPALPKLQKKLVELLPDDVRARYMVGREFTPHVTLLQAKPLQSLDPQLMADFKARMEPMLPVSFDVTALTSFVQQRARSYRVETIA